MCSRQRGVDEHFGFDRQRRAHQPRERMNDDDLLREFSTAFRTSSMFLPRRLVFLPPAGRKVFLKGSRKR